MGNEVFAWICSGVSVVMCILIAASKVKDDVLKWIMLGMLGLWRVGVGFLTFDGPYVFSRNAYFACWAALIVSKMFVWRLFHGLVPRSSPEASVAQLRETPGPGANVVGAVLGDV